MKNPIERGSDEHNKHSKLLNASGFAFQLALEATVRSGLPHGQWKVAGREYPWVTREGRGYVDLILRQGNVYLVIECKRTGAGEWIFLLPDDKQRARSHARIRWTDAEPNRRDLSDWGDIQIEPASPEVEFCVVRGTGENDRPLLERIASQVAEAAEGLSADLLLLNRGSRTTNVVVPVIVTNANLLLARFDPHKIDLKTGVVTNAFFTHVPHVRFRKSLAPAAEPHEYDAEQLRDLSAASERTVFVVRATDFATWLSSLETGDGTRPWESARNFANAMGG